MTQLAVGDHAPEFSLLDQDGRSVALNDLLAGTDKGVIVYFYPKASTPGCTKEACDFRDSMEGLKAAGYAVVGISPAPVSAQAKFASRHDLPFPLLSDADHVVIKAWGVWGEKKNYGKVYTGVIRSTVVVAPDGTVTLAQYNVRATGHVKRLRAALGVD